MRYLLIFFSTIVLMQSCKDAAPDVSNIKVDLRLQRFEEGLFGLDTTKLEIGIDSLLGQYKGFGENFVWRILQADPNWGKDTLYNYLEGFINTYRPVYDSVKQQFSSFKEEQSSLEQMLRYVKYYFPSYNIPSKIITYIGPLDGYGDLLDTDAVVVGMQHHLGEKYNMYQSEMVNTTYPAYISRRFTKEYIDVNAASNIVGDMYPAKEGDFTLIEMMIQAGKKLYLMQKLLPKVPAHTIIGYTQDQWEGSEKREDIIWAFFLQNNLLQSKDRNITKNYIGDSPKTQELGEASPGNIGAFCGWKIVNQYMSNHSSLPLDKLMLMPDNTIYQESKYKP